MPTASRATLLISSTVPCASSRPDELDHRVQRDPRNLLAILLARVGRKDFGAVDLRSEIAGLVRYFHTPASDAKRVDDGCKDSRGKPTVDPV